MTPPIALSIAGSDSSGGAGIQADLKAFSACGVYGATVITALTAQNTCGVRSAAAVDEGLVQDQLDAVLDDLQVNAVKTGMLATAGIVTLVARAAAGFRLPNLVVDPVMVATSGDRLLDAGAEAAYRERLLPHALVATPNLSEASVLTDRPVYSIDDMVAAGEALRAMGVTWVLVKGGHLDGDAIDVLVGPEGVTALAVPRVRTVNTHGTGCSLAAAIAARLALGDEPPAAVRAAKAFVSSAVASAAGWRLGGGHGPIDHFGWSAPATTATGTDIEERSLR
jgi:hydroxymethylpyrimidine kinase/phosphomethylpyrimidine kinase